MGILNNTLYVGKLSWTGPWTTFRRVTLPLIQSGLFAGSMFAFIVSFDLFTMSIRLKGVGQTTLPIQFYQYLQWDFDPVAAAVATVNVVITFGVVILLDRTVGLRPFWV